MNLHKLVGIFCLSFILIITLFSNITNSEETLENIVDADIEIEFSTGTELKIAISMNVNKITLTASDRVYTKNEINSISESNPEIMGAIKYALKGILINQIKYTFENADVISLNELPNYQNQLFYDEYDIILKSKFFNMNESVNIDELINGLLDIGAIINYSFNFNAELGWNNSYTIILPEPFEFQRTTGSVKGDKIQWNIRNIDDNQPNLLAELSINFDNSKKSTLDKEDIKLEFYLNCSSGKQTILTNNIIVKNIDIEKYKILPEFISNVKILPSDGLRLLIQNNLLSWEKFYNNTISPIKEKTISIIENSSFNQTLNMSFYWDKNTTTNNSNMYNTTNMNNYPPIKAIFTDKDINLKIYGITPRALFGLVNAGAQSNISSEDINFGEKLNEIGYPYNISLLLPEDIYLDGKKIYVWNNSHPIKGKFESYNSKKYLKDEIDTFLDIKILSTDLNILSFFTGGTKLTLNLFLQETQNRNVTTLPKNFNLPKQIQLDNFNSDAFRVCIDENIFNNNDIDVFLNEEKQLFENKFMAIFSILDFNGIINRDEFYESLKWDKDIKNMDGNNPLKIVTYSHYSHSIPFKFSFIPPKFEISEQILNLTGIINQNITYKILFPKGINVEINDSLNRAHVFKTEDGEYLVILSFNESEYSLINTVSLKISPSILYIFSLFTPCILTLIITIILVLIIFILRKKGKNRGPKVPKREDKSNNNLEDQEYYIPPPSSR